jgi:hypothetical protein
MCYYRCCFVINYTLENYVEDIVNNRAKITQQIVHWHWILKDVHVCYVVVSYFSIVKFFCCPGNDVVGYEKIIGFSFFDFF